MGLFGNKLYSERIPLYILDNDLKEAKKELKEIVECEKKLINTKREGYEQRINKTFKEITLQDTKMFKTENEKNLYVIHNLVQSFVCYYICNIMAAFEELKISLPDFSVLNLENENYNFYHFCNNFIKATEPISKAFTEDDYFWKHLKNGYQAIVAIELCYYFDILKDLLNLPEKYYSKFSEKEYENSTKYYLDLDPNLLAYYLRLLEKEENKNMDNKKKWQHFHSANFYAACKAQGYTNEQMAQHIRKQGMSF